MKRLTLVLAILAAACSSSSDKPTTSFRVTQSGAATAGSAVTFTVAALDNAGAVNAAYRGTVHFTSDDGQAALPADVTFAPADNGQKTVSATFKTAGARVLVASDTSAGMQGMAKVPVSAGAAVALAMSGVADTVTSGGPLPFTVSAVDAFGNVADGFTGTVSFACTDASAVLPGDFTFTATDKGTRVFSVILTGAASATITASSVNVTAATGHVTVVPGPTRLVVTFAGPDAWAGAAATATVTATDAAGNRVHGYSGTVAFTSSDAAAGLPANLTFVPTDGGQKTASVTFNTIGAQTLTATDTVKASATGTGSQAVHGLVYTNPAIGGKVRLVVNAAGSNAALVQLDLVSNTSLFPLTAGTNDTVRNGAFAAGMNLPLDTAKVAPDTALLSTTAPAGSTAVLNLGAAPQAVGATIANGILYTGISQKRLDATAGAANHNARGDVAVRPFPGGSSFYYSLRLKLTPGAAPGAVFDGQALASNLKFRAAVRDRSGSDVFSGTTDFAIGRLEVR